MSEITRIASLAELEPLIHRSQEAPVLLFKHSLTCPVSSQAYRELQRFVDGRPSQDDAAYGLVEVQNAREVSNEIAARTGVRHESPQALLLRDERVVWHASHWAIDAAALGVALAASSL